MATDPIPRRHPHLEMVREQQSLERKKTGGGRSTEVSTAERKKSAERLAVKLDEFKLEVEKQPEPPAPGIKPHLVFRVPVLDSGKTELIAEVFERAGLKVVSFDADGAIVVFREEPDIAALKKEIARFAAGPGINPRTGERYKTTNVDVLHSIDIEGAHRWQRANRLGKRLVAAFGSKFEKADAGAIHSVDVELWHPGEKALREKVRDDVKKFLQHKTVKEERISDEYLGETIILLRVRATAATLNRLADLDAVAEIELPPVPVFDRVAAYRATAKNFQKTVALPADAPSVCVIDSGIVSGHPLIQVHVGGEQAILTANKSAADTNGHGTLVGGLAVFGDVRACYQTGDFRSPVKLFSARVLNDDCRFDDEQLVVTQMRRAIETFAASPHNCRVFNISIGGEDATLVESRGRQKAWAEVLDILARKHRILIIVSAGNVPGVNGIRWRDARGADAEAAYDSYPEILWKDTSGLCEPASAAIAVTVGALAEHDAPAINPGQTSETTRPLAGVSEPAPYTRVGPGIRGAIKPEFSDFGGNLGFRGLYDRREIYEDPGMASMSLSHKPVDKLFDYASGTSFAAPRVAHKATRIWKQLEEQLRERIHPNLVRAVMATSAVRPRQVERATGRDDLDRQLRVSGYGVVDSENAASSSDTRVTLVAQGELTLDHFVVYGVPIPDEFTKAPGEKFIDVALAYDPPVRSRRLDYLGVEMTFDLLRDKDSNRVIQLSRKVEPANKAPATEKLTKVDLLPRHTTQEPGLCQRDRSTLQCASATLLRPTGKHGDVLWLVVKAWNRWVPVKTDKQSYAVAVTLRATQPRLYEAVRAKLQLRAQARQRSRA